MRGVGFRVYTIRSAVSEDDLRMMERTLWLLDLFIRRRPSSIRNKPDVVNGKFYYNDGR